MTWRIEIRNKPGVFDTLGGGVQKSILDLGLDAVTAVAVVQVYNLIGELNEQQIRKIADELLTDKITQQFSYSQNSLPESSLTAKIVEIAYNPGVMDPVEQSVIKGIKDLGIKGIASVSTAKKYILEGNISKKDLDVIVNKVLANKLIQHEVNAIYAKKHFTTSAQREFKVVTVDLLKASSKQLTDLSQKGQLFLNLTEMQTIQSYYKKLKRNPTDVELETIAQTWSEHCYHKTFRGNIRYKEKGKTRLIKSLFKSTIVKATTEINKSWCVSVFHDNAGVIKFDDEHHVCFKAETHNHPSALEPFGGANTGIGGVIRDTLGTGLGAKPICSTDVFCFAPPDMKASELPPGTLHPKRVFKGVVSGVRDYGNKMGIPTVNGAILFDKRFVGNPLVFCGSVGLIPKDKVKKQVRKGDLVVVMGGRTGRDGIHGATFSSGELTTDSEVVSSGAVQIGNPIEEKKVLDALMQARDAGLYTAVTDCGAGGLSSAVGEMGKDLGARIDLNKVPLKYQGLNYTEIWISESQERMVLSVPPKSINRLKEICEKESVEAAVIGEFDGKRHIDLFFDGNKVCHLDVDFLFEGTPNITKEAVWAAPKLKDPKFAQPKDLTEKMFESLAHYNVCSKESVIRVYDHEVQGTSVIKPLVGINCDGPSDASIIAPKYGSTKGIAVSNGINFRYGMIDPYWMAASCIDEAVRQIISVGGSLDRIAILDNFCWGNPDKPDRLGGLVRCAEGCYFASVGYKVPFISGKDSLYNEYTEKKKSIAIPGTILISAIGIIDDVRKAVTMDLKKAGNLIYAVGETHDELGGSIYLDTYNSVGSSVPAVDCKKGVKTFNAVSSAVHKGLIRSIHDCSEGGLGVALAEMAFAGGCGVTARLDRVPYKGKAKRDDYILFSESNSRFIVEIDPVNQKKFEQVLTGVSFGLIGRVESTPEFIVYGTKKNVCVNTYISELKKAWKNPLNF
jgi:phosphoribosylformylglycinamidine synthase II